MNLPLHNLSGHLSVSESLVLRTLKDSCRADRHDPLAVINTVRAYKEGISARLTVPLYR